MYFVPIIQQNAAHPVIVTTIQESKIHFNSFKYTYIYICFATKQTMLFSKQIPPETYIFNTLTYNNYELGIIQL